jgi:hypothetical protein
MLQTWTKSCHGGVARRFLPGTLPGHTQLCKFEELSSVFRCSWVTARLGLARFWAVVVTWGKCCGRVTWFQWGRINGSI